MHGQNHIKFSEMLSSMPTTLHVNYPPVILVKFELNLNFLTILAKRTQISNFMKICPVGAELFHAARETDMTKLIIALRNLRSA